jgi:hypothetical protein
MPLPRAMNSTGDLACPSFASSVIGRENRAAQFPSPSHAIRECDPAGATLANRSFFSVRMPREMFRPCNLLG